MGKKLTAFLMSLIIILPLVAQAWATPQIAYAAVDTETSAPAGESDKSTSPAGDSSAAESSATDGSLNKTSAASSSLAINNNATNKSTSAATDITRSDASSEDDQLGITSTMFFSDGSVNENTTFKAGEKTQLKLTISNSGKAAAFTDGKIVIKLSKKEFVTPVQDDFTGGQDYMENHNATIDSDSDPDNYLISYQLKSIGQGSDAELPFYVTLKSGQDVGIKATITETLYKIGTSNEIISQNQVEMPYTVEILTGFSNGSMTLNKSNWQDSTLSKTQDMDISRMLYFSFMTGEDSGSTNSPLFVKVTLPRDKVTFDAAKSPDWTYDATTGVATYQVNHKISRNYPSTLIVHPILSANIQADEKLPFKVETGFVNDNPKNYITSNLTYTFIKRKVAYTSYITAVYSKYKNHLSFTDFTNLDVIKDQVSAATTYDLRITPIQFATKFEDGDTATITQSTFKPNLEDGSLHLNTLHFYATEDKMSDLVRQELQNNTVTLTPKNGKPKTIKNMALGDTIDLSGDVYQSIQISFERPIQINNVDDTMFYFDINGHLDQDDVDNFRASQEATKRFNMDNETNVKEQDELVKSTTDPQRTNYYGGSSDYLGLKKAEVESTQAKITRGGYGNGVQVRPGDVLYGNTALVDFGIKITNPNQLVMKNPRVYFLLPVGLNYDASKSSEVKNLHDVQAVQNFADGRTLVTGIPNVDKTTSGTVIFTIPTTAGKALLRTTDINVNAYFSVDNNYYTNDVNDPKINENFAMDGVGGTNYQNYGFFDNTADPTRGISTTGSFNYTPPASLSITSTTSMVLTNFVEDLGNALKPDEGFNYQLAVKNSNAKAITKFQAIDVLPYNDGVNAAMFSLADALEPEKSDFNVQLTGPVKVVDYDQVYDYTDWTTHTSYYKDVDITDQFNIYYSEDIPDTNPAVNATKNWTLTPTDYSKVRMIKIELKSGNTIEPYKGIRIHMPVIAPESNLTLPGKQAFNSFTMSTNGGESYLDSNDSRVTIHQEQGNLNITKLDDQDNQKPLAGAKFKIYNAATKQEVGETNATSASGTVTYYNLPVGTYYAVESVAPDGYVLDTTPTANFKITDGADTPITIYNEREKGRFGKVTLNYVDAETGETIRESQVLSDVIGTEYNVGLTKYFMTIPGYEADSNLTTGLMTDGKYTGQFTEEDQNITFKYHKYAKVTVEYLDHQDKSLFANYELSDIPGKTYDTSANIVQIDGYQLDSKALPANATGKFTTAEQTVKYYYNKLAKPITINYIDELTNDILTTARLNGLAGDSYDAGLDEYKIAIPGYELDTRKLPTNTTGTFSDTTTDTIEYFYRKFSAPVTVQYVDEAGNAISGADSKQLSGFVGDDYDTKNAEYQVTIPGYDLDSAKIPDNAAGKYTNDPITVTYVYKQNAQKVTVRYVDQNNKEFQPRKTLLLGDLGDKYDATTAEYRPDFPGYKLDQSQLPDNAIGNYGTEPVLVTYHYNQIAQPVNVKYVDQAGKAIKTVAPITGNVGDAYATKQEEISGYKFDRMKDDTPTSGKLGTKALTVTYIYDQVAAPVTVKYVDQAKKEIRASQVIADGLVGKQYDVSTDKYQLATILTADGHQYQLDTSNLPTNVKGDYSTKSITVTYSYKEVAQPVTVKYVDQHGQEIRASQSIPATRTSWVGDAYDVSTAKYKLMTISGEHEYRLDNSQLPENATGYLQRQAQTVTYVYDQVAAPVTVKYQDQAGQKLHAAQTLTGLVDHAYDATTDQYKLSISGYQLQTTPTNAKGTFTDQGITVTYVYKQVTTPTGPDTDKPGNPGESNNAGNDDNSGNTDNQPTANKVPSKTTGTVKAATTTKQQKLPQANENQQNTFVRFVVGMFLLVGLLIYTSVDFRQRYRE